MGIVINFMGVNIGSHIWVFEIDSGIWFEIKYKSKSKRKYIKFWFEDREIVENWFSFFFFWKIKFLVLKGWLF